MKLSEFVLFKNTPPLQINKTIHFKSNEERDIFYSQFESKSFKTNFNFRYDRGQVKFPESYENYLGYEYGYFIDGFSNQKYYFFIQNYEYINNNVTKAYIILDLVTTFTQGGVLNQLKNLNIEREHLTNQDYERFIKTIRLNNDILETHTKKIIKTKRITFESFYVVLTTTANFEGDFGTEKAPKLPFSKGGIYDNVTSPLNLYLFKFEEFNENIKYLEKFSWIAQNIVKCVMIPAAFIDTADLIEAHFKENSDTTFYKLKNNGKSIGFDVDFKYTYNDLLNDLNLTEKEIHLLKSNYVNIYLTDYSGNKLTFDSSKIYHLDFRSIVSVGYLNLVKIFLDGYESDFKGNQTGAYLDYTLTLNDFDELPVYINNAQLQKAKSSYTRELENSKTVSGRINQIQNGSNKDKIFNSLSLFSSVFSGGNIASNALSLYSSEYDYYRDQKAKFKEMDLSQPTVTTQSTPHSLQIKTKDYGIFLVISSIDNNEMINIKKYHAQFGFEMNKRQDRLSDINSMSLVNYVKFTGSWKLNDIDIMFINTLSDIFSEGVLLYKPISKNPFEIDILTNKNEV